MNIKEKADALVDNFFGEISHAITSVEYTIEVLDRMRSNEYPDFEIYNEQTEILKELKSRI